LELVTYDDCNFVHRGTNVAYAEVTDERPRLETKLAGTESQLREASTSIDRYLRLFEAALTSEALCIPRIAELFDRKSELTARQRPLLADSRSSAP
jgi:hypothetical protein